MKVGRRKRNKRAMKVKVKVKVKSLSGVRLFVTPWTVAYQVPPSMGFSKQEYWNGYVGYYYYDLFMEKSNVVCLSWQSG